jgi:hypothetical protein
MGDLTQNKSLRYMTPVGKKAKGTVIIFSPDDHKKLENFKPINKEQLQMGFLKDIEVIKKKPKSKKIVVLDDFSSYLTTHAEIGYWYFCLNQIKGEFNKPKSPVVQAIDRASGFEKHQTKETIRQTISVLKKIIKLKDKIGENTKSDVKTLKGLEKLKVSINKKEKSTKKR